eukprot:m.155383 g.155383  ORF g.155383 m.155383 type:complete len:470 (-) comp17528_c0_seq2:37-1446(-)
MDTTPDGGTDSVPKKDMSENGAREDGSASTQVGGRELSASATAAPVATGGLEPGHSELSASAGGGKPGAGDHTQRKRKRTRRPADEAAAGCAAGDDGVETESPRHGAHPAASPTAAQASLRSRASTSSIMSVEGFATTASPKKVTAPAAKLATKSDSGTGENADNDETATLSAAQSSSAAQTMAAATSASGNEPDTDGTASNKPDMAETLPSLVELLTLLPTLRDSVPSAYLGYKASADSLRKNLTQGRCLVREAIREVTQAMKEQATKAVAAAPAGDGVDDASVAKLARKHEPQADGDPVSQAANATRATDHPSKRKSATTHKAKGHTGNHGDAGGGNSGDGGDGGSGQGGGGGGDDDDAAGAESVADSVDGASSHFNDNDNNDSDNDNNSDDSDSDDSNRGEEASEDGVGAGLEAAEPRQGGEKKRQALTDSAASPTANSKRARSVGKDERSSNSATSPDTTANTDD